MRRKHWCWRGLLDIVVGWADMDSHFLCCSEEDGYQRRLTLLLMEMRRNLERPTVVSPDLFPLPEDNARCFIWRMLCTTQAKYTWGLTFVNTGNILGGWCCHNFEPIASNHRIASSTTVVSTPGGCGMSCLSTYLFPLPSFWCISVVLHGGIPPQLVPECARLLSSSMFPWLRWCSSEWPGTEKVQPIIPVISSSAMFLVRFRTGFQSISLTLWRYLDCTNVLYVWEPIRCWRPWLWSSV